MTKPRNYNCFIDSNIWLYAFSSDQKEDSKRLLAKQLISEEEYITISTQVINEVSYNLRKKHKIDEQSLLKLIISFYAKYPIIPFNLDILESASHLRTQYHLSFWDSLIIASALYSGANTLYSEDMQDGLIITKKLTIVNPFNRII